MKSEIQFMTGLTTQIICKAKSIETNDWVVGYYSFIPGTDSKSDEHYIYTIPQESDGENDSHKVKIIPDTLCKFTGALDANCEMIFENDVADILSKNCAYPLNESVVNWSATDFAWSYSCNIVVFNKNTKIKETMGNARFIEVKGNVFD